MIVFTRYLTVVNHLTGGEKFAPGVNRQATTRTRIDILCEPGIIVYGYQQKRKGEVFFFKVVSY